MVYENAWNVLTRNGGSITDILPPRKDTYIFDIPPPFLIDAFLSTHIWHYFYTSSLPFEVRRDCDIIVSTRL